MAVLEETAEAYQYERGKHTLTLKKGDKVYITTSQGRLVAYPIVSNVIIIETKDF